MADHNEGLQLGFLSAKDLQVSQSAHSQKLRFQNENVGNNQEFAKTYAHSLRKQNQAAENKTSDNNQSKHSAVKPDQTQSAKQHSVNTSNQSKQQSTNTTAAENGRNLPQNLNDSAAAQENAAIHEKNPDIENRVDEIDYQEYENAAYGIAGSAYDIDKQAIASGSLKTNQNGFGSMAAKGFGAIPIGQVAQSNLSLQNGSAITVPSQTEHSNVALNDSSELLDLEQHSPSTAKSRPVDALLRSAAEENLIKAPVTNALRPANELNKNTLSTAELFAHLNSGQSGQEADGDAHQIIRQESTLFKDRLLSLAQQNTTQTSSTSVNDLNKLLAQQTTQLSPEIDDRGSTDFNVNAAKDPGVSPRLSSSPLHMLSPMLQMSSTLEHKGWSNEVGQRVMWMVNADLQQAQLQLNPKHLGPIEIKISMSVDQQINVNFLAHSATVKEALDQALPRLREVFDQSGLNLNDVNVQQESHKQHSEHHHTAGQSPIDKDDLAENMQEDVPVAQIFQNQALSSNIVDFFA
jgi:flagellar hook-length control protein FliK